MPFTRVLLLLAFGIIMLAGAYTLIIGPTSSQSRYYAVGSDMAQAHFAPADDLEAYDIALLDTTKFRVDVAMYAFTDRRLADELVKLANRGVRIRLERDGLQLSDERARAAKKSETDLTRSLIGFRTIEVRVKGGYAMHLKAYCIDGTLLRTGSANWSEGGERNQDNDMYVLRDPLIVRKFSDDFNRVWNGSMQLAKVQ